MSRNRALQSVAPRVQQVRRPAHAANQASDVGIDDSPFLTLEEGARLCRFDATSVTPTIAFRKWLHRQGVPIVRRGRVLLVDRRVLMLKLGTV